MATARGGNSLLVEPRDPYDVPPEDGRTEVIEREPAGPPPWWREHWWVPLLLLLLLVGALLAFAFLRGGDDDEDRVAVPDVVGLQEPEAREEIVAAGLEAQVDRVDRDATEGEVVAQEPGPGTELDEGDVVLLLVSTGGAETQTETETVVETETETEAETETETEAETETETDTVEDEPETTQMPDAAGSDFRDAARAMLDAGLLPTSYPVESDEPQGTVVAQEPEAGSELDEESVVRMNVSLGPGDRAEATVPDVTGPEIDDALEDCHDAGFTCRVLERAAPDEDARGEALDQRPAAGTQAPALTQITLYLGV